MDLVHRAVLLPGRPGGRLLRARHAAATLGPPRRRAGGAARLLRRLPGVPPVPDPADAGPHPAAALLAHAVEHHPRRGGPQLQVRVADVGRLVGAGGVRAVRHRVVPGRAGARPGPPPPARAAAAGRRGRQDLERRRCGPGAVRRRLHRGAPGRLQPAGVERHLGARRALPRLRAGRLGRAARVAGPLPAGRAGQHGHVRALRAALVAAGTLDDAFGFPWILLWLVAFAGLLPGLGRLLSARLAVTTEGAVVAQATLASAAAPWLILLGVLALRAAVILSAQL